MNPLFYFLLALTTVLAANAAKPVLDTDGDFICDGSYYVLPAAVNPEGGGLTLASRGGNQCPLFVGQEISEVNWGIPVRFSDRESSPGCVTESESLNIEMDIKNKTCAQSTYWWLTVAESQYRMALIALGPKPKPGEDSTKSFFQIRNIGGFSNDYTIMYCPKDNRCINVVMFEDEYGVRRFGLGLGFMPYPVKFVKAETSSKTMSNI